MASGWPSAPSPPPRPYVPPSLPSTSGGANTPSPQGSMVGFQTGSNASPTKEQSTGPREWWTTCQKWWAEQQSRHKTVGGRSIREGTLCLSILGGMLLLIIVVAIAAASDSTSPGGRRYRPILPPRPPTVATCDSDGGTESVQRPVFWKNVRSGQTSWFASPVVIDLDGDNIKELVTCWYDCYIYDNNAELIAETTEGSGRSYAPHVVADLDNDGIFEVVTGRRQHVYAYEYRDRSLQTKAGWPKDTTLAGYSPEVRGLSAADIDNDGYIEVAVTTTQTRKAEDGGAQVFVLDSLGNDYQPPDGHSPAWPRYNRYSGEGNDKDFNCYGHHGYGCYGLNVGIGNIDDDDDLEVLATYDNHHIQAFKKDGIAINAAPYFLNRASECRDSRMTWGQFIRWTDPVVEGNHYNLHTGSWPNPGNGQEWLQWTASPPAVADLDLDGKNEVIGVPNIEKDIPYVTQAYGIMVLEGSHGDGSRSARRKAGWETLPRGGPPIHVDGWYPPSGVPATTIINILGDAHPEIIVSLNDGWVYCYSWDAQLQWAFDYTHGKSIMYSSEVIAADLNRDGKVELLFTTYGDPDVHDSGYLVILQGNGELLWDIPLPNPGHNGNGNGAPAAPAVGDLDGDGELEIFVQTFDHGMDIFKVPGSSGKCLVWPTARGGRLRIGQGTGY